MTKKVRCDLDRARSLFLAGDYQNAFPGCLRAAENEDCYSALLVGWMYLTGSGAEKSIESAIMWLRRATKGGDPLAAFYLGRAYEMAGDPKAAVSLYEWLTEQDFSPAYYRLAELYLAGSGVERNTAQAYALYERAMELGHLFGKVKTASFLIRGHKGWNGRIKGAFMIPFATAAVCIAAIFDPESKKLMTGATFE